MARRRTPGLRKRNGVWHIQKQVKGYGPLYESAGTSDQAEAERYLAFRLEEIRRVIVYGERPSVTFREAAEKFLNENSHLRSLDRAALAFDHVMPYIGDLPLDWVHNDSLARYRQARLKAGIKAGTLNRELGAVRRVLNLAARVWRHPNGMTYLPAPPLLERVPGVARKPYPLEWDEQRQLLLALPLRLEQMALFVLNTGLRDQEICQLRWSWEVQVPELETSVFVIPAERAKNGEERVVMLNRIARRMLEAQRGKHAERVFTYKGVAVGRMLNTAWKRARVHIGLPRLRVHDLRHTFGHRLRSAGVHLEDRKALLGHTVGDVTTHYSAPDLVRLLEYANRICDQTHATVLRVVNSESGQKSGTASGAKMHRLAQPS
jgi:integrase